MSKRAERASLKSFPEVERAHFPNEDEYIEAKVRQDADRFVFQFGYKQAEKDTIERACKWLFSHLPILVYYYDEDVYTRADRSDFIKQFRTQMEDEK